MKKLLLSLALGSVLLGQGIASQAVAITVTIPSGSASPLGAVGNNFIAPGIFSDAGFYQAVLIPSAPQTLDPGGTVSYGTTIINTTPGAPADNFTNKTADFTFDLTANSVTHQIQVIGRIDSTFLTTGGTDAAFLADSLELDGGAPQTLITTIPTPGGRPGRTIFGIDFNGQKGNVWVEVTNNLTQPGSAVFLSVGGFVNTVPEPGSMAMLFGIGVSGSLLLRRRRRA